MTFDGVEHDCGWFVADCDGMGRVRRERQRAGRAGLCKRWSAAWQRWGRGGSGGLTLMVGDLRGKWIAPERGGMGLAAV